MSPKCVLFMKYSFLFGICLPLGPHSTHLYIASNSFRCQRTSLLFTSKSWNNFLIHNVRMYSYVLILKLALIPPDFLSIIFTTKKIRTSCEFQLQQISYLCWHCHYIARALNHATWDSIQSATSFSARMENQTPIVTLFFQIRASPTRLSKGNIQSWPSIFNPDYTFGA